LPFAPGEAVGLYRVLEQLGQGGMATVFRARHTILDRDVALKVLHPAFLEDPNFLKRFQREARVVAALDHPNIVPIFEFSEHEGQPYLVMKFIEGETLKARLQRGPIPRALGLAVMTGLCRALTYAHDRGILHRDVKPSNILIAPGGLIYLTDFGLARIAAAGESTLSGETMIGTPQYISPEQARSVSDLDHRTDIYSAGIVLYEIVVGIVPFDADTPFSVIHDHLYTPPPRPSSLVHHVSPALEATILRALEKEREARYPSASELLRDFLRAAGPGGDLGLMRDVRADRAPQPAAAAGRQEGAGQRGSPQAQGRGGLSTDDGRWIPLVGTRLLLGREDPDRRFFPDIDLSRFEPTDPVSGHRRRTVHREQARLYWEGEEWCIEVVAGSEDRASRNAAPMVVGEKYRLAEGDELTFGAVRLTFRWAPMEPSSPDEAETLPPRREG
jgi:hypothetical protein